MSYLPVGYAVVGVQHYPVVDADVRVVFDLGAEGLDDPRDLVAGEQGAVSRALVGGALGEDTSVGQLHGQLGG